MAFLIDVASVAGDGRVVRTAHALRPWRFGHFARRVCYLVDPAGAGEPRTVAYDSGE